MKENRNTFVLNRFDLFKKTKDEFGWFFMADVINILNEKMDKKMDKFSSFVKIQELEILIGTIDKFSTNK